MRRYTLLIWAIIVAACAQETEPPKDTGRKWINVGVNLSGTEDATRSLISAEAEDFRSAILFALDPDSGNILLYDSNAGSLCNTPVYVETTEKNFSWPLPEGTAMDIYCIVNPPAGLMNSLDAASVTATSLRSLQFTCTSETALSRLGNEDEGLPMAGVTSVTKDQITEEDASLYVSVKYLFAKYRFSLDLSGLEEDESLEALKLSVMSGNTAVPYFTEGFSQSTGNCLMDFDYATDAQLAVLSKGGSGNHVDIYVIENCHGTHAGASRWWTVYQELSPTWQEIQLCTSVQLSYRITCGDGSAVTYVSRIYLGEADMVSDFNVRRNLFKNITVKVNRHTGESDPYFTFDASSYFITPGTTRTISYNSNLYAFTSRNVSPDIWFADASGSSSGNLSLVSHDPISRTAVIRASASCTPGDRYLMSGGKNGAFYWPPYGSDTPTLYDTRQVLVSSDETLTFDASAQNIYPYQRAEYISRERFTQANAQRMASGVKIKSISGKVDMLQTSVSTTEIDGEYAVMVSLVPSCPGVVSFNATYGEASDHVSGPTVSVLAPVLKAFCGDSVCDEFHVDVMGNSSSIVWKLLTSGDGTPLPEPLGACSLKIGKQDSYGTCLAWSLGGNERQTIRECSVYLAGFDGLPGFDPDNYTFSGISVPLKGKFTYPGGYQVSCSVSAVIDNPFAQDGYDGKTIDYAIHQGRSAQEEFVSVSLPEYKVEYMQSWPQRTFSVDLTRGGTRSCGSLETWTEYSSIASLPQFAPNSGKTVRIQEDLHNWGPVYYGKRIRNIISGECRSFIHSIIRLYCHYNVFAAFDAREKNKVNVTWDNLDNIDWDPIMLVNYHFGGFKASVLHNFSGGSFESILSDMILTDITSETRVKPILDGYSLSTDNMPFVMTAHGYYSGGKHDNYQHYVKYNRDYMLGYYAAGEKGAYRIYYDWVYIGGEDNNIDCISWRVIAANNTPWFRVHPGGMITQGKRITNVVRSSSGEYCLDIIPYGEDPGLYADPEGLGYQRIALFWEGRQGRVMVRSKDLSPLTSYDTQLCIVNGWYSPEPYKNGVPVLANKVGAYFFPENTGANTRSGYPPYYDRDWPYSLDDTKGYMEIEYYSHLDWGDLAKRDKEAAR